MDVVPMTGAVTPGFAKSQANEICAMDTPFFFANSSMLSVNVPCQPHVLESNGIGREGLTEGQCHDHPKTQKDKRLRHAN